MNGILFKPDMIQAIVEGRKTQTRRLDGLKEINQNPEGWEVDIWHFDSRGYRQWQFNKPREFKVVKPRYHIGQTLYIKEPWATMAIFDNLSPKELKKGSPLWFTDTDADAPSGCGWDMGKPRSPMFLMEWMTRNFIQITDVRPERLQDITEDDAVKEGIRMTDPKDGEFIAHYNSTKHPASFNFTTARQAYSELWDEINGESSWSSNPWVWVYSFKLITPKE